jgi:xylitol oxidase
MTENLHNWADNLTYGATRVHRPESVEEVQALVVGAERVKALGTRHSFSAIADTDGDLISLENLARIETLDREARTVTVQAGTPYGRLCQYLHEEGFGIHNLASLPHISVAGACATATHGSGDRNGCLSTAVTALEIVTADGSVVTFSRARNPEEFPGAVVGLGALGVVTRVTFAVEPQYQVAQVVYENLPLTELEANFDAVTSSEYSVSLFTDWSGPSFNQVWQKRRVGQEAGREPEPTFFGATLAKGPLHPIPGASPVNCTEQRGVPGPSQDRLPHFRMDFTPSSGEELQSEYLVPRRHILDALRAVEGLRGRIAPLLQISEIRTVAADDFWMSPFYGQPGVGIHFTWKKDWAAVRELLPVIEAALAPYDTRPHWGKLSTMPGERIRALYPRLADFQGLRRTFDPQGKFRNAFLDANVG